TVVAGIDTQTVAKASVAVVNVDTTVQDKAIAYPDGCQAVSQGEKDAGEASETTGNCLAPKL
ncbi:MAG TPA: hypothetical protein VEO92_06775, partial [Candidatus Nitrosocosmicus sp.]|nr:hypothetical protein [Candidatus Nitrosocosmicus sp.]